MTVLKLIFTLSIFSFVSSTFATSALATEVTRTELEQKNLDKALYCMEILENRNDLKPAKRIEIMKADCIVENYIQHSPHVPDGREALLAIFAKRYKKFPQLSMSVKRAASEGDLVWLHLHVKRTPDSLGSAVMHVFRMENGKFAEHWGVSQRVPETSKNNNTMF